MLVTPSQNPVRNQAYEAQIEYHKFQVQPRQLWRMLQRHTKRARRYKCAYIKKTILPASLRTRHKYGKEHQHKTIHNFWRFVFSTDEAHIDPTSILQDRVLREGTRYDSDNIQEKDEKKGVKLYITA
jgi:hypothetical protein